MVSGFPCGKLFYFLTLVIAYNAPTLGAAVGFTQLSGTYWTSFNNSSASTVYVIALPSGIPNAKPQGSIYNVRPVPSF